MEYLKKLIGDRIYLSPKGSEQEEVQKYTEWMNDFNVTDYIGRSSKTLTFAQEKEWLEASAKSSRDQSFNIIELDSNNLIGSVGLKEIDYISRSAVLGIFIGEDNFRSKGFGTEAIMLLLEYAFKYLNLHSIRLNLIDVNERAHKCYLKCGFKDSGRTRDEVFLNGKYHDKLHMDILESDFEGDYIRNKNL